MITLIIESDSFLLRFTLGLVGACKSINHLVCNNWTSNWWLNYDLFLKMFWNIQLFLSFIWYFKLITQNVVIHLFILVNISITFTELVIFWLFQLLRRFVFLNNWNIFDNGKPLLLVDTTLKKLSLRLTILGLLFVFSIPFILIFSNKLYFWLTKIWLIIFRLFVFIFSFFSVSDVRVTVRRLLWLWIVLLSFLNELHDLWKPKRQRYFLLVKTSNSWRHLPFFSLLRKNFSSLQSARWRNLTYWLLIDCAFHVILLFHNFGTDQLERQSRIIIGILRLERCRTRTLFFVGRLIEIILSASDFNVVSISVELPVALFIEHSEKILLRITCVVYAPFLTFIVHK